MTDMTIPPVHEDFRITAISDALLEHKDLWTRTGPHGFIVYDTEIAAVIAVAAVEQATMGTEYETPCSHACHRDERSDVLREAGEWAGTDKARVAVVAEMTAFLREDEA